MELRHLRYFTSIVNCKGYREASRSLHIAQPALTQTVHDLEEEVGTALLIRERKHLSLTPAGKVFYTEAKAILKHAQQAVTATRRAAVGITGTLTIGMIPGSTQCFLPGLLRTFKEHHPSVEIDLRELTPTAQIELLLSNQLDLAFTRAVPPENYNVLSSRWLFHVPLMAVLPGDKQAQGTILTVASLKKERLFLLGREQSPALYDSIMQLCADASFKPRVTCGTHMGESVFTLVGAGEGISIVPAWAHALSPCNVHCVRLIPDTVRVELVAAWKTTSVSNTLQSFLSILDTRLTSIQTETEKNVANTFDQAGDLSLSSS